MAEETPEQKLARLEAENKTLREQVEQRRPGQLRLKVSEKGGVSVYGLGRFPVTLYKEQWIRLLDQADEIKSFLKENDQLLKAKQQENSHARRAGTCGRYIELSHISDYVVHEPWQIISAHSIQN